MAPFQLGHFKSDDYETCKDILWIEIFTKSFDDVMFI